MGLVVFSFSFGLKSVLFYIVLLASVLLTACSPKQNTASSRRWQAFTTRYNVYHNAITAYKKGEEAQRTGLKEDYTARLPVFSVGYEKMQALGKNDFATAITKCEKAIQLHSIKKRPLLKGNRTRTAQEKAFLERKEFNPFLKNVWLLMGRAQFQQGEFLASASTFAYITRFYAAEPEVVAEARVWLARCYAQLGWHYDAEDALQRLDKMGLNLARFEREHNLTMADFLIRQERIAEALPYLQKAARQAPNNHQQARLYYILGQVHLELGQKAEAYEALQKCLAQNPTYELAFHARILQTEALTTPQSAQRMIGRLKAMTKAENNKDYLDQVYYAMGNIHLAQADTASALTAYETGRYRATQSTPDKGLLLLRLGDLYWTMRRFDKAQPLYAEAIGLLGKDYKEFARLSHRSKTLDALVPHTNVIFEQDSLLALVAMPEVERHRVIDRAIAEYKLREREARLARADSAARAEREGGMDDGFSPSSISSRPQPQRDGNERNWYFYNPSLVQQGKQSFAQQWGRRRNEDDWRRSNRSMLAQVNDQSIDYAAEDSLQALAQAQADSLARVGDERVAETDSVQADPTQRDYYLRRLPFSPQAQQAAHQLLQEALLEAGIIEKDALGDLPLADETLRRLVQRYPAYERLNEAYYHLFLLAKRRQDEPAAAHYRQMLTEHFPQYAMTRVVADPDFDRHARYGREIEDSLYAATYNAYVAGQMETVAAHFARSTQTFPHGANRPKFLLVHALSRIGTAPRDTLISELRALATNYPRADVAEMAAMMVKGLESGRAVRGSSLQLGGLWARRNAETAASNAAQGNERKLTAERLTPFVWLVAYPTDSLPDDSLLFALARFNFTTYVSRGFDIQKERTAQLTQFRVHGLVSYEDAHAYAQHLFRDPVLARLLRRARIELISEANLRLLGTLYSFEEYRAFFDREFAPLRINPDLPLDPAHLGGQVPQQIYEDEVETHPAQTSPSSQEAPSSPTDEEEYEYYPE